MDLFAKKYCDHKQDYCLLFTLYSQNYTHILLCFVIVWWQRSILPIVFKVTSLVQYYHSPNIENCSLETKSSHWKWCNCQTIHCGQMTPYAVVAFDHHCFRGHFTNNFYIAIQMLWQLCYCGMCKNLLEYHSLEWKSSEIKFPLNSNCGGKMAYCLMAPNHELTSFTTDV